MIIKADTYIEHLKVYVYGHPAQEHKQWYLFPPRNASIINPSSDSETSVYGIFHQIIREESDPYVLLCEASVWLGRGIVPAANDIIQDLQELYPNWGVCGNFGVRWDGKKIYPFARMQDINPINSLSPKPVLNTMGGVFLLNVRNMRERGVDIPCLHSADGFGLVLSCEALKQGLLPVVDCRLVSGYFPGRERSCKHFEEDREVVGYLQNHFINHLIPTAFGPFPVSDATDYGYLLLKKKNHPQKDLVSLFDGALSVARKKKKPSIQIVCRTQLDRLHLLDRAVASFAVAYLESMDVVDMTICIATDQNCEILKKVCSRFKEQYPFLPIEGLFCPRSESRFSRVELLVASVMKSTCHYVWFVDDDDFVLPAGIPMVCRALAPDADILFVGASACFEEKWENDVDRQSNAGVSSWKLAGSKRTTCFHADGIFRAFSGDNFTPICSVLFPTRVMKQRLADVRAEGDYLEDYFVLLMALTAERIEVETIDAEICGISFRGSENTVREVDRSRWEFSYATFLQELFMQKKHTSPLFWQLWQHAMNRSSV